MEYKAVMGTGNRELQTPEIGPVSGQPRSQCYKAAENHKVNGYQPPCLPDSGRDHKAIPYRRTRKQLLLICLPGNLFCLFLAMSPLQELKIPGITTQKDVKHQADHHENKPDEIGIHQSQKSQKETRKYQVEYSRCPGYRYLHISPGQSPVRIV